MIRKVRVKSIFYESINRGFDSITMLSFQFNESFSEFLVRRDPHFFLEARTFVFFCFSSS
jgi:hypothetical protein